MFLDILIRIFGINSLKYVYLKYKQLRHGLYNNYFWYSTFIRWWFQDHKQFLISMKIYNNGYLLISDITDYAKNLNGMVTNDDIRDFDGDFVEVMYGIGTKIYIKNFPRNALKFFPVIEPTNIPTIMWKQMMGQTFGFEFANFKDGDGFEIDNIKIAEMYAGPDGSELELIEPSHINPWLVNNLVDNHNIGDIPIMYKVKTINAIEWWTSDGDIIEK